MEVRQEDYSSSYFSYLYPHQPLPSFDDNLNVNNKTNRICHDYLSDTRSQPRLRNMQRNPNTNESTALSLVDVVREKNFQSQHISQFASYQQSVAFPHIFEDENLYKKPLIDVECNDINSWNNEGKLTNLAQQLAQLSVSTTGDDTPVDNCSLDSFACRKLEDSSALRNNISIDGQLDSLPSNSPNSDTDWSYFVAPTKSTTSSNTNKKSTKEYSFFSDSSSNSSNGSLNGASVNHIDSNNYAHESVNVQPSNAPGYENFNTPQSQFEKHMEVMNCISSMPREQLEQMMKMIQNTMVRNQLCPSLCPTEMLKPVKNIRAHSSVRNEESSSRNSFSSPRFQINNRIPYFMRQNEDILEIQARNHHTAAIRRENVEPSYTWSGELPRLSYDMPISNKVFVGGLPYHITEDQLVCTFRSFGNLVLSWPGKERGERFKGFVYVIFQTEQEVQLFLNSCRDCGGNLFFTLSLRNGKTKEVQIIPWSLVDSSYPRTFNNPFMKFDTSMTVFVGALHGTMSAQGLFKIMDELFSGVIYAAICVDKYKYPTGSGRIIFNNYSSYVKAVSAGFVKIKTSKFQKTVIIHNIAIKKNVESRRVRSVKKVWTGLTRKKSVKSRIGAIQVDQFMEDVPCSVCSLHMGPYFCREKSCFRYFCSSCWKSYHAELRLAHNTPLKKNSKFVLPGVVNFMMNGI